MPERPQPQRDVLPDPRHHRRPGSRRTTRRIRTRRSRRSSRCGRRSGAPNVLIVLIDDVGFGASSAFGGPIAHAERRAARRRTASSTTASTRRRSARPTRQALLTGRNHHSVGMGGITEIATSAPGYNSIRPNTVRAAGRDAEAERLLDGAVRQVPRGAGLGDEPDGAVRRLADRVGGFEHFYGFIGGETNQYAPAIYQDTVPVEPDRTPEEGYHFTEDMTDQAIDWIRQQKALMPDKPFFVYFAPGATHAPHHVPTGVVGQVQGQVRRRLGRAARADVRAAEGARRDPGRRGAHRARPTRSRPGTTCPTT